MGRRWEPMLEQLVDERYQRLVARAMLLVPSRHDAEDLVQDALVATFGGRARFRLDRRGRAVRAAGDHVPVRRPGPSRCAETDALARVAGLPDQVVDEPSLPGLPGELKSALARLSPRQRACVMLRHLDDLSVRETASCSGSARAR